MFEFFDLIRNLYTKIILELSYVNFSLSGFNFSLWNVLVGFLLTSMLISIFWKGARG